jgi:hypothetical protein
MYIVIFSCNGHQLYNLHQFAQKHLMPMQLNHFLGPVSPVRMWLLSGFKLMRGYYVGSVRNLVHRAKAEL